MYTYNYKLTTEQTSLIIDVPKDLNKLDIYKAEKYRNLFSGYKVFFNVQNTTDKSLKFFVKNSLLCVVSPKSDFSCQLPQNVFTDYMIECQIVQDDSVLILGANNEIIVTFTEWQGLGFNNNYNNNQLQRKYIKMFSFENKNDIQMLSKTSATQTQPFFNVQHTEKINSFVNYINVQGAINLFLKNTCSDILSKRFGIYALDGNGYIKIDILLSTGEIISFVVFSFYDYIVANNTAFKTRSDDVEGVILGLIQKDINIKYDIYNFVDEITITYFYDRNIGTSYNSMYEWDSTVWRYVLPSDNITPFPIELPSHFDEFLNAYIY